MDANHKKIDFYGKENMTRFSILKVALFILVLVLCPSTEGQFVPVVPITPFAPRPLCNYQMALANQACSYLPFIQAPPAAPRAPLVSPPPPFDEDDTPEPEHTRRHGYRHDHDEDRDHDHDDEDPDHDHDDEDPDHDHDDEDHDHDDDDHDHDDDDHDHDDDDHDHDHDHDHEHEHNHNHGHKHHHHHRRHHHDTPVEQQCCKWLSQVDDQCVCELLIRLPPFLARPLHKYSVIVGRACNITYTCGSRLRK